MKDYTLKEVKILRKKMLIILETMRKTKENDELYKEFLKIWRVVHKKLMDYMSKAKRIEISTQNWIQNTIWLLEEANAINYNDSIQEGGLSNVGSKLRKFLRSGYKIGWK